MYKDQVVAWDVGAGVRGSDNPDVPRSRFDLSGVGGYGSRWKKRRSQRARESIEAREGLIA